jgi:hypothetical protein
MNGGFSLFRAYRPVPADNPSCVPKPC